MSVGAENKSVFKVCYSIVHHFPSNTIMLNVVFAGTPEFARQALDAIVQAGFSVPLVMTQPDRPAGRGMKLTPSPVKQQAVAHNIPVIQPVSLRLDGKYPDEAASARQTLQALQPDVMVVAAYGLILPQWVLRSEEHTSELQSRENLVCRLLLEKKKKNKRERRCHS